MEWTEVGMRAKLLSQKAEREGKWGRVTAGERGQKG